MQLSRISITAFMGRRALELQPTAPVTLLCGPNGAGKSSTLEAIRAALVGEIDRAALKKDYASLVTEGERIGTVIVEGEGFRAAMTLPAGKHETEGTLPEHLAHVLDARRFAAADAGARRAFLLDLLQIRTAPEAVAARLVDEFGCDADKVAEITPLLARGFDAAQQQAKTAAAEGRGAWKAVTNEAYGEKKADAWRASAVEAPDPEQIAAAEQALHQAEQRRDDAQAEYGAVELRARQYADAQARISVLRKEAGRLNELRDSLARHQHEHDTWRDKLAALPPAPGATPARAALACPECSAALALIDGSLQPYAPAATDPEAEPKREQYRKAVELHARGIVAYARDLAAAERASVALAELDAVPAVEEGAVTVARERAQAARTARDAALEAFMALRKQAAAADDAERRNSAAARHHATILGWSKLAEALSESGLPARLVADALAPFNATLARFAQLAGWPPVILGADMAITFGGRLHRLLSESEQWRVDALLALAIAALSGTRFVLLDRADVLDLEARAALLYLLSDLVEAGELEQAIVAATLKARPEHLPPHHGAVWLGKESA